MNPPTLPYAASARTLARMFDLSQRTIQRWDQRGYLTRLQYRQGQNGRSPMKTPTREEIWQLARNSVIQRRMAAILDQVNGRQSGDEFRRWAEKRNQEGRR